MNLAYPPLLVPCLGLDVSLLERLAASIDFPLEKWVINNGPRGALDKFIDDHFGWRLMEEGHNHGCAGTWNLAPQLFPESPYWIICNDDYWFHPGYLEKMVACADKYAAIDPIIFMCVEEKPSWPCFVWTARGLKDFGTFDENFWPIYYEDCDMMVRHKLYGYHQYRGVLLPGSPQGHAKARRGSEAYTKMIGLCNVFNEAYWLAKWGNNDYFGTPAFATPFDVGGSARLWDLELEGRKNRESIYAEFIAHGAPLYE